MRTESSLACLLWVCRASPRVWLAGMPRKHAGHDSISKHHKHHLLPPGKNVDRHLHRITNTIIVRGCCLASPSQSSVPVRLGERAKQLGSLVAVEASCRDAPTRSPTTYIDCFDSDEAFVFARISRIGIYLRLIMLPPLLWSPQGTMEPPTHRHALRMMVIIFRLGLGHHFLKPFHCRGMRIHNGRYRRRR